MKPKLEGQIRHALSGVGLLLIAAGAMTPDEAAGITEAAMAAAGAVMALWALVWSWRSKS